MESISVSDREHTTTEFYLDFGESARVDKALKKRMPKPEFVNVHASRTKHLFQLAQSNHVDSNTRGTWSGYMSRLSPGDRIVLIMKLIEEVFDSITTFATLSGHVLAAPQEDGVLWIKMYSILHKGTKAMQAYEHASETHELVQKLITEYSIQVDSNVLKMATKQLANLEYTAKQVSEAVSAAHMSVE